MYDSETVAAHVEQLDENFSRIAVAVRKQGIDGATLLEDTRKEMLDNLCVSKEIKLRLGSEIDRFRDAHAPVVYRVRRVSFTWVDGLTDRVRRVRWIAGELLGS